MAHKIVTSPSAGAADKVGGVDWNKLINALQEQVGTDPLTLNIDQHTLKHSSSNLLGDLVVSNGTRYTRRSRGTANQILRTNPAGTDIEWADAAAGGGATDLNGLTDVTITSAARGDIIVRDATAQYVNKAKGTANQFLRMDGTGTDPVWTTFSASDPVSTMWRMYIDPANSKVTATNGITTHTNGTGASDTDAGEVIMDIFDSVGSTARFSIFVDPGDYPFRSWSESRTRRGNFSIIGSGQGTTRFIATTALQANRRVLAFEAPNGTTTTTLTVNASKGTTSITVTSASGFAVGDDIILCSDEDWDGDFAGDDRTQLNRIVSISGNLIMLEKFASETFNTASNARIIKQTVLRNIYLADFSVEAEAGFAPSAGNEPAFLRFDICDNVFAENIGMKGVKGNFHTGLVTNMIINSTFSNWYCELPASMGHFTQTGPYGISCRAACENVTYENFQFIGGWRHCFTTTGNQEGVKDGVPKNIFLVDCKAQTCGEATYDTHGQGENLYFINCAANGYRSAGGTDTASGGDDTDAFNFRNRNCYVINPMITDCRGRAFSIGTQGYGHKIMGGYIRNIRNGFKAIEISSGHDMQISGLTIDEVQKEAIVIGDFCNDIQISDIHITNVCYNDNTLSPITGGASTSNVSLNNIMLDTSNDAAIVPIKLDAASREWTLSNITLIGAGKDCTLSGVGHKLDDWTCRGRNLERPLRKLGRWTAVTPTGGTFGLMNGNVTATGGTRRIESTDGLFQEFVTSTLNQVQGIKSTNNYTERDLNPYIRFTFRVETLTNMRMFLMWTGNDSALGPAGADPLANNSGIGLKLDSGGSNFVIYHNSGDATSTSGANIGTADTNKHVFEMRADNANAKFQYRYDYDTWTDIATDIPSSTADLCMQAYMENNETGVSKNINLLEIETSHDNK